MNKNLSPVLLFAYNRPKHLIKVLNALKNNFLATQTDLIVNCDGKKNKIDKGVDDVKKICESINGFKSVRIIKNKKNTGLAASIIKNVTKEIKKSKKLIILEDDIITSKTFLIYMNSALDYYKNKKNVWHISGHSLFDMRSSKPNGIYLSSYMNCWGWGTWENRWCNFEKNTEIVLEKLNNNEIIKKRFQIHRLSGFYEQVVGNYKNEIDTWAIFWYWQIFKNKKFCINPNKTLTKNIGQDGTGTHKDYNVSLKTLNDNSNFKFSYKKKNRPWL